MVDTLAIELHNLSKQYGGFTAVSELNLTVQAGEMIGFLGPNGAGKTTTIRLLTGFLKPTQGGVRLLGQDMAVAEAARAARRRLGYVPDVAGLDPAATGEGLLRELAQLQGCDAVDQEALLAALELRPSDLKRPMGRLSRGTRQKINIVQGLQHRPDLLVLDEPTEGLDPLTKRALFTLLQGARARGATIFFSSHILSEVEALCDRVALIRHGRLVTVERISTLQNQLHRRVTLHLTTHGRVADTEIRRQLQALPTLTQLAQTADGWQFHTADLPSLLNLLAQWPVEDLTIAPPSLEDIFLQFYE